MQTSANLLFDDKGLKCKVSKKDEDNWKEIEFLKIYLRTKIAHRNTEGNNEGGLVCWEEEGSDQDIDTFWAIHRDKIYDTCK